MGLQTLPHQDARQPSMSIARMTISPSSQADLNIYAYTKPGIMLDGVIAADMRPRTLFEVDRQL